MAHQIERRVRCKLSREQVSEFCGKCIEDRFLIIQISRKFDGIASLIIARHSDELEGIAATYFDGIDVKQIRLYDALPSDALPEPTMRRILDERRWLRAANRQRAVEFTLSPASKETTGKPR